MSRTVFILGAGASREAGGPLMQDFLDHAQELYNADSTGAATESYELAFRGRAALQAAHSKSAIDLDNIETLFGAFDLVALFGSQLPGVNNEEAKRLPAAMRSLIVHTLETRIRFGGHPTTVHTGRLRDLYNTRKMVLPPAVYEQFGLLIQDLIERKRHTVSILTFNYDLALDYMLHYFRLPIQYCLESTASDPSLMLLKLHGSLNWVECSNCKAIVAWELPAFFKVNPWDTEKFGKEQHRLLFSQELGKDFTHCGLNPQTGAMIVPPTMNKTGYHQQIANVWRHAAGALSDAENIFVIGYSLPFTDEFFRYLYALGTIGRTILQRFWVFDPEPSGQVRNRFEALRSHSITTRFSFRQETFRQAVFTIGGQLLEGNFLEG